MERRESLLVSGGRCLDVVTGDWRDVDVRIVAGRIVEVGPDLAPTPGVPTLDATGATSCRGSSTATSTSRR